MPVFIDQLNREVHVSSAPKRIVSLVPSQTELLYDLGLEEEVIGITKFCLHPQEWFRTKTRVGGTKKIDFEKIKNLAPDLIIGNKEENEQLQIEELMKMYPVWMSDIYTLDDAFQMILKLGEVLHKGEKAKALTQKIGTAFGELSEFIQQAASGEKSVAYFIWRRPYMVAGAHTFIDHMLTCCGFKNVFSTDTFVRYPEINPVQLSVASPDYLLLSSEPYPFKEKHIAEFQAICPTAKIITVDGELFSWYGSRLIHSPGYFRQLIQSLSR